MLVRECVKVSQSGRLLLRVLVVRVYSLTGSTARGVVTTALSACHYLLYLLTCLLARLSTSHRTVRCQRQSNPPQIPLRAPPGRPSPPLMACELSKADQPSPSTPTRTPLPLWWQASCQTRASSRSADVRRHARHIRRSRPRR
jgi:hypothetical protein